MKKVDSASRRPNGLSAGMDEVGRGALAGPMLIVTAAYAMNEPPIAGIKDSKKTTKKGRAKLAGTLVELASYVGLGWASPGLIDSVGVEEAWQRAALASLSGAPPFSKLTVDGRVHVKGYGGIQEAVVKADDTTWQVSAASIIAKFLRDMDMQDMSAYYPWYSWEKNSGYGTAAHREGLLTHGPTPYHRRLFIRSLHLEDAASASYQCCHESMPQSA